MATSHRLNRISYGLMAKGREMSTMLTLMQRGMGQCTLPLPTGSDRFLGSTYNDPLSTDLESSWTDVAGRRRRRCCRHVGGRRWRQRWRHRDVVIKRRWRRATEKQTLSGVKQWWPSESSYISTALTGWLQQLASQRIASPPAGMHAFARSAELQRFVVSSHSTNDVHGIF